MRFRTVIEIIAAAAAYYIYDDDVETYDLLFTVRTIKALRRFAIVYLCCQTARRSNADSQQPRLARECR